MVFVYFLFTNRKQDIGVYGKIHILITSVSQYILSICLFKDPFAYFTHNTNILQSDFTCWIYKCRCQNGDFPPKLDGGSTHPVRHPVKGKPVQALDAPKEIIVRPPGNRETLLSESQLPQQWNRLWVQIAILDSHSLISEKLTLAMKPKPPLTPSEYLSSWFESVSRWKPDINIWQVSK